MLQDKNYYIIRQSRKETGTKMDKMLRLDSAKNIYVHVSLKHLCLVKR